MGVSNGFLKPKKGIVCDSFPNLYPSIKGTYVGLIGG